MFICVAGAKVPLLTTLQQRIFEPIWRTGFASGLEVRRNPINGSVWNSRIICDAYDQGALNPESADGLPWWLCGFFRPKGNTLGEELIVAHVVLRPVT